MKFTSQELFDVSYVLDKEIDRLQQEIAKAQHNYLKGRITEAEEEKKYKHYNDRIDELARLKQKVFNAAYAARFDEL